MSGGTGFRLQSRDLKNNTVSERKPLHRPQQWPQMKVDGVTTLVMLKFCDIFKSNTVKREIAIVKFAANKNSCKRIFN